MKMADEGKDGKTSSYNADIKRVDELRKQAAAIGDPEIVKDPQWVEKRLADLSKKTTEAGSKADELHARALQALQGDEGLPGVTESMRQAAPRPLPAVAESAEEEAAPREATGPGRARGAAAGVVAVTGAVALSAPLVVAGAPLPLLAVLAAVLASLSCPRAAACRRDRASRRDRGVRAHAARHDPPVHRRRSHGCRRRWRWASGRRPSRRSPHSPRRAPRACARCSS